MNFRFPDGPIKITVKSRSDMASQLQRATQGLQRHAQQLQDRGILVTRHSARDFTVELHESVPFGLTQERQDW